MKLRSFIPARLAQKFYTDYKVVMKHYEIEEKIELTQYLQNLFSIYLAEEETKKDDIKWIKNERERLKIKFGKKYKAFRAGQLHTFLNFEIVLAEKDIYSTEEYNNLMDESQSLSDEERKAFLNYCGNALQNSLDELYLELEPESQAISGVPEIKKVNGKVKREANDKRTCLSQDQTVLLMHYLQQEHVILRDEYLSDLDAGRAFEILTGYSQHTLRQNLSDANLNKNDESLKTIDHLLTRLKIAIGNDLKKKQTLLKKYSVPLQQGS